MTAQNALDEVKQANDAYYAALSARDLPAMEKVWARTQQSVNIAPPVRPAVHAGWDAVEANYLAFWSTLDQLTVSMAKPAVQVHGTVAWVYGIEQFERRAKDASVSIGQNFGTSIFIKTGPHWLMVFHQAASIPTPR
jgi:hypothetical protein